MSSFSLCRVCAQEDFTNVFTDISSIHPKRLFTTWVAPIKSHRKSEVHRWRKFSSVKGSTESRRGLGQEVLKKSRSNFPKQPHLHNHLSPTWESCIFIIRRVGRCDMDGSRSACYIPINCHRSPGVFQGSVQGLYEAKSSSKRQVPEIEISSSPFNQSHLRTHLSATWESHIYVISRVFRCDMEG